MKKTKESVTWILNVLIIIFVIIGTFMMYTNKESGSGLMSTGLENLKYFTVLSNEFAGIVSLLWIIFGIRKKEFPAIVKLMSASGVGLTFLIIAAFLQPLYPDLNLYAGGNLWFHLIVPITAMIDFVLTDTKESIPFKYAVLSGMPALIYGTCYLANILMNGIGVWPESNDWYGFLNWGYPVGMVIFAMIVLMQFGIAVLLRFLNKIVSKYF